MLDLPFNDIQFELAGLDVTRAIKLMKKTRIKYANRGRLQL